MPTVLPCLFCNWRPVLVRGQLNGRGFHTLLVRPCRLIKPDFLSGVGRRAWFLFVLFLRPIPLIAPPLPRVITCLDE